MLSPVDYQRTCATQRRTQHSIDEHHGRTAAWTTTRRLRRRCAPTPAPRGGYLAAPPDSRVAVALLGGEQYRSGAERVWW